MSLLDESIEDLRTGKLFYEKNEPGIGVYFTGSAMADIISLRLYAGIHSIRFGYYRMLLKRFPFAVYYDKDGENVYVVAVLDMRQNPASIRAALKERRR